MTRPMDEMAALRAEELLLQRATEGLDEAEAAELAALGADHDLSYDLAAAAIDLATVRHEPMPAGLADKIAIAAGAAAARPSQPSIPTTLAGVAPPRPIVTPPPRRVPEATVTPIRPRRAPIVIAYVAAAACIALAAGAVLWARRQPPRIVIPAKPSPAEARATLLAEARDLARIAWTATSDEAARGAEGDVVWSTSKQQGFMRFVGLAPNDPAKTQYQLWIFDGDRDQAYPVDGGVFDVSSTGEVIVPISARIPVGKPVLFAVTVEPPGGVVVSKRERIVVTATPG